MTTSVGPLETIATVIQMTWRKAIVEFVQELCVQGDEKSRRLLRGQRLGAALAMIAVGRTPRKMGGRGKKEKGNKKRQLPEINKPTARQHDKPHCAAVDRKIGELEEREGRLSRRRRRREEVGELDKKRRGNGERWRTMSG
jgi:hypothetical protein